MGRVWPDQLGGAPARAIGQPDGGLVALEPQQGDQPPSGSIGHDDVAKAVRLDAQAALHATVKASRIVTRERAKIARNFHRGRIGAWLRQTAAIAQGRRLPAELMA